MDVLEIPFNRFLGFKKSDENKDLIFKLEHDEKYLNHLGTIHASALFALAEASSGEFLFNQFVGCKLDIIPVVRKVEVKYSKPAIGTIYSKTYFSETDRNTILNELTNKNRVIIKVGVDILNATNEKLFVSTFDWFISIAS